MQIYYYNNLVAEPSSLVTLPEELARHLSVVLRHNAGDTVMLCDGAGSLFECEITRATKRSVEVRVLSVDRGFGVKSNKTVAVAPTKNMQRLEWAVEKIVEIGVGRIVPIISEHSERRNLKIDRLERIAKSAAQQSLKGYLTEIAEPMSFSDFVEQNRGGYIAHCNEGEKCQIEPHDDMNNLLIGPEGDFSVEEVNFAIENGYRAVTLGDSRLRTETAAVVATYLLVL